MKRVLKNSKVTLHQSGGHLRVGAALMRREAQGDAGHGSAIQAGEGAEQIHHAVPLALRQLGGHAHVQQHDAGLAPGLRRLPPQGARPSRSRLPPSAARRLDVRTT